MKFNLEFEPKVEIAGEGKGFMAISGWHANYADFTTEQHRGTINFIGGKVGVIIDGKMSFHFDLKCLIEKCLEEADKAGVKNDNDG